MGDLQPHFLSEMQILQKSIKILKSLEDQKPLQLEEFLCGQLLVCKGESHCDVPLPLCFTMLGE